MTKEAVQYEEEERRKSRAVKLVSQVAWTKWDLPYRKLTWTDLWRLEPFRISFLPRPVYDTLPTPANLHRWGLREDQLCRLCGERGTLAHILAGCRVALSQGRYKWHHDRVLATFAHTLEQESRKKHHRQGKTTAAIKFVEEGERLVNSEKTTHSLLQGSQPWDMKVDLGERLQFPQVVHRTLRPDVVL
uniref:Uncharacterized protein n=1 Tax=Octopus bimaculoides TaxID=37653 RepID=A0A0L8IBV9_OCTBM